jgi:hypothetical protein
MADIKYVTYEQFGAVGDGVTDDYAAIRSAHEYANAEGLPVRGKAGATYYLGTTAANPSAITIKTSTDWQGAKFIIDDRAITATSHPYSSLNIFEVKPTLSRLEISPSDIGSLSAGATNLGYAPGVDCLVHIENSNVKHYIRYGQNANSGSSQHELIVLDAEGRMDPTAPFLLDYNKVSYIYEYRVDDTPITVQGGHFTTIYNQAECVYRPYERGIMVTRSNSTVKNVTHLNTGEGETGAPSGGFTIFENANNVLFENIEYERHIITAFIICNPIDCKRFT